MMYNIFIHKSSTDISNYTTKACTPLETLAVNVFSFLSLPYVAVASETLFTILVVEESGTAISRLKINEAI